VNLPWLGMLFLAGHGVYFWRKYAPPAPSPATTVSIRWFQLHRDTPSRWAVIAQTLITLVIFAISQVFVAQLESAGPALGLSPVVVGLLLSPVATELPGDPEHDSFSQGRQNPARAGHHLRRDDDSSHRPPGVGLLFTRGSSTDSRFLRCRDGGRCRLPAVDAARPQAHPHQAHGGSRVLRRVRGRARIHGLTKSSSVDRPASQAIVESAVSDCDAGAAAHGLYRGPNAAPAARGAGRDIKDGSRKMTGDRLGAPQNRARATLPASRNRMALPTRPHPGAQPKPRRATSLRPARYRAQRPARAPAG